ncbi:unnamed protein product [Coccothraustes coccothraustes]
MVDAKAAAARTPAEPRGSLASDRCELAARRANGRRLPLWRQAPVLSPRACAEGGAGAADDTRDVIVSPTTANIVTITAARKQGGLVIDLCT